MKVTNIGSETRIFEYQGGFKALCTPIGVSVTKICISNNFVTPVYKQIGYSMNSRAALRSECEKDILLIQKNIVGMSKAPKKLALIKESYETVFMTDVGQAFKLILTPAGDKTTRLEITDASGNRKYNKNERVTFDSIKTLKDMAKNILEAEDKKAASKQMGYQSAPKSNVTQKNVPMTRKEGLKTQGEARFRYLTEQVIKNHSIYRDTYKNSSQAFALVKADFINHVDDATFIRIIDNILYANISNQQGTKGKK